MSDDFGPTRMFHTASPGNRARRLARQRAIKTKPVVQRAIKTKIFRTTKKDHVAEWLSQGKEIPEIAALMDISVKAVKRHIEKIRSDLGP